MTEMRAVVVDTPNEIAKSNNDLKLSTIPKPTIKSGEVLVKIVAFGVNRMDLLQARGLYPLPPQAPKTLGVEFSGVIVDVSENSSWKIDQEVFGLAYGGAYAEYIAADQNMILEKPDYLTHIQAAGICENYLTAHQAIKTIGKIKPGSDVLIHAGASGVGMAAIQLARHYGAKNVFTTAGSDDKLNTTKSLPLGATHGVNYRTQKFDEEVLKATQNKGVDIIVDMVGQSYFNANINALAKDGHMIMLGVLSGMVAKEVNIGPIIFKRLHIEGSTLRSRPAEYQGGLLKDFKNCALAEVGKTFDLKIHKVFKWTDIAAAHDCMSNNENTVSGEPSKFNANYDSITGNLKESAGNILGYESLKESGAKQHASGEAEKQAATAKQYTEGATEGVQAKAQNVFGAVTGDKEQQAKGAAKEDKAEAKRNFA
ncbi:putative quinone oxidoreductase [Wallemia mellicola]|uniref:Putative quinone oxidoreductase n=1 Tax=Wallemia mellicola TaxID=1708541 RepID=A0A4T0PWG9_9BASI|nr:putative quinone oxidoreductase [Wallemia mellicola]TIB91969.1 putative quinone oxidoreductase [Wallemia mellicola]TIB97830.1 putative quinone oxidoreductase [Wallemia mellicola]TIC11931.1 putative quinone oxidoreductase [Wallemia mellicola]TIC14057.1 putative quinone oxidoreductase [Wallemia mellicola]